MSHKPLTPMRVLQISPSHGENCGIAFFAENLQRQMQQIGIDMETVSHTKSVSGYDVILLHHHTDLISDAEVTELCTTSLRPVVLFAHVNGIDGLCQNVDGIIAMCPGMVEPTETPVHIFPHPAWTPKYLEDRTALRQELGYPDDALIVATNGFLKFERQFVEIISALLPHARTNNWFVDLITSPWRLTSPGLIERFVNLRDHSRERFRFQHSFLDSRTLNRRLQACDLLWCWTAAASSPYASGVISDQYASGTRIFAADKQQHEHVLSLPNVVRAPGRLEDFVDQLLAELRCGPGQRHDPAPVSWDNCITGIAKFLRTFAI